METDWRELLKRDDIDAIDVCTPDNLHKEISLAAAAAGKMILCEKPLAMNQTEGAQMCQAVEKAGVQNMVWYNYRRVPAVTLAKQLIDEGRLGRIFHYRTTYCKTGRSMPMSHKAALQRGDWMPTQPAVVSPQNCSPTVSIQHCGSTAALKMSGRDRDVRQRTHACRNRQETSGTIDDACSFFCRSITAPSACLNRLATHAVTKRVYTLEINGEHASIRWDLHDLHRLQYFSHGDDSIVRGWRSIHVSDGDQPYMGNWWVPGLQIGYEHTFIHQVADFLKSLETGEPCHPTFRDAQETQKVCDAVLDSAATRAWKNV